MFSPKAREKLKYYVYLYIDPVTDVPFYIGKGQGNRAFSHLHSRAESKKVQVIERLKKSGMEPRIEILKYGLTEAEALLVEATAIDLLGVENLTNELRGYGSRYGARGTAAEIASVLDAKKVTIGEPAILITINRAFRYGMSPQQLYDATRSCWKVGDKREEAEYALSVYRGVVREVYRIAGWVRGGSTMQSTDKNGRHEDRLDRWEFLGKVANEPIRKKYVGKSVAHYYTKGAQNPIMYVNC